MTAEEERTRLIGEIARVLRDGPVPDEARSAALTLIGWLARRMPGEPVSVCDLKRCTGAALTVGPQAAPHPGPLARAFGRGLGSVLHEGAASAGITSATVAPPPGWSHTDDPPVSTVNGPNAEALQSAEAPASRRSRSAR